MSWKRREEWGGLMLRDAVRFYLKMRLGREGVLGEVRNSLVGAHHEYKIFVNVGTLLMIGIKGPKAEILK